MSLPISPITNGESGSSVRAKLNQIISDSTPSISTPKIIYVESNGADDGGVIGDPAFPFATANAAYNAGVSTALPFVLSLGYGSYSIILYNDFNPNCIAINGKGSNIVSNDAATILSIHNYFNGTNANDSDGISGYNVNANVFNLNLLIELQGQSIEYVSTGNYFTAGNGGNANLFGNAVIYSLNISGGSDSGGSSGSVNGGNAGQVYLNGNICMNQAGTISAEYGNGWNGGATGSPAIIHADGSDLRVLNFYGSSVSITLGRCSYLASNISPTADRGGNAIY